MLQGRSGLASISPAQHGTDRPFYCYYYTQICPVTLANLNELIYSTGGLAPSHL